MGSKAGELATVSSCLPLRVLDADVHYSVQD